MDKNQFDIICKKLDKLTALLTVQNIQDKGDKIYALKKSGLTSSEIGVLVGMTESGIRDSKGWKRK